MIQGWQRVAERVITERVRRGYRSMGEFSRASGLSTSTIDSIEHARKDRYDPATIAAVENTLGWKPGSVERLRQGLGPIYDADPDLTGLIDVWHQLSPGSRRLLRLLAEEAAKAE